MESPVFTGMVRLKSLGFKPATGSPFSIGPRPLMRGKFRLLVIVATWYLFNTQVQEP